MTQYKILSSTGYPIHGGKGRWRLPKGDAPGKWMPAVAGVKCCSRGYHLVTAAGLPEWVVVDAAVFEAEGRGASDSDDGRKTAYAEARLLRRFGVLSARLLRLWAADCAERVLPIYEAAYPGDARPRKAVEAVRAYADGEIGAVELHAAADPAGAARAAAEAAAELDWQGKRLIELMGGNP